MHTLRITEELMNPIALMDASTHHQTRVTISEWADDPVDRAYHYFISRR